MIIAFTGYAGSGKDTAAQILVEKYGFVQINFADHLRDALGIINPIVASDMMTNKFHVRYNDAICSFGYTEAKKMFPEIRKFMQRFATDWARDVVDPDFWINLWRDKINTLPANTNVVITDLRFPNEEKEVHSCEGRIIRINRPGYKSDGHKSEDLMETISEDFTIDNTGTIEELQSCVEDIWNHGN